MFNQLIESEPAGADFQNRRKYFLTSSVVVGILFVTAVVVSIYAADIGLGNQGFELTELVSPPEMAATEPEPVKTRMPAATSPSRSEMPTRQANIADLNETPPDTPTTISTTKSTQMSRPRGYYQLSAVDSNPGDVGRSQDTSRSGPSGLSGPVENGVATAVEKEELPPPPVVKKPVEVKPKTIVSDGVINGKASYLPKPIYSQAAIAVHAEGKVDVQVLIDENGTVISAKAVSGHPMLRAAAEQAARNARFSPTLLSHTPVKVTGVIAYNFTH